LGNFDESQSLIFGNKATQLARLLRQGFRVPNGFVVPGSLLNDVFARVVDIPPDREPAADFLETIRTRIEEIGIPDDHLRASIAEAARTILLSGHSKSLVARSSASNEDGPKASFAGVFRSIHVEDIARLDDAICKVYASRYSMKAYAYAFALRRRGHAQIPLVQNMSVLVQEYVPSNLGGVLFTQDPAGSGKARLEIAIGGAEKVVSGTDVLVSTVFDLLSETIDDIALSRLARHIGLDNDPAQFLHNLSMNARQILEIYGKPQDIEWVWDENIWILQTRDLTTGVR